MDKINIRALAAGTINYFQECGYTNRSVAERERILRKIVDMHDASGAAYFSQGIVTEFVSETEDRYRRGEISRIYYRFLNKTANYLVEFRSTGTLRLARQFISPVSDYYDEILSAILEYSGWNRKSSHSVWSVAKTYFKWLITQGYYDLSRVTVDVVKQYLVDCASRLSGSSLDTIRRAIKKICVYLFEQGVCTDPCERLFSFAVPIPKSIKSVIPQEEIALTLGVIDRDTNIGKRDYASILLAVVTGLRAVDISNLKLNDIDWRNGEIRINQSKTGKSLALPLTTDVGTAIQDYVLNGRPASELTNVFLRSRSPASGITHGILYGQFNTYRVKAGLPRRGFHGLRRTLGTNMVISGAPVTTVSQTLGHADLDSTRRYISLDSKHLKDCALDFSGIQPNSPRKGR